MTETLKPALVSYSDAEGGAARAALRLHSSLGTIGVESTLHVRKKLTHDPSIVPAPPGAPGRVAARLRRFAESRINRLQHTDNPLLHSANLLPTWWSRSLNRSNTNVINTHWIGAGAISIRDLARLEKPVVMTLHDMWAFCGSEHYTTTSASARWRDGYSPDNRPAGHRGIDLDRRAWERKRRWWRSVTVVTPSEWLAGLVRDSALMGGWPVSVVPNALDVDLFRPRDQGDARHQLGLPSDATIVLFGAVAGGQDPRKGFDLLLEALPAVQTDSGPLLGVVFGEEEPAYPPATPFPLRWLGRIEDDDRLSLVYSAADVMVMPSRQEAVGQTGTEAQACGTPVVAFNETGSAEVVDHRRTGYLAKALSVTDLARGIDWVLEDGERLNRMRERARQRALELWRPRVVANQYVDVYRRAIERSEGAGAPGRE